MQMGAKGPECKWGLTGSGVPPLIGCMLRYRFAHEEAPKTAKEKLTRYLRSVYRETASVNGAAKALKISRYYIMKSKEEEPSLNIWMEIGRQEKMIESWKSKLKKIRDCKKDITEKLNACNEKLFQLMHSGTYNEIKLMEALSREGNRHLHKVHKEEDAILSRLDVLEGELRCFLEKEGIEEC